MRDSTCGPKVLRLITNGADPPTALWYWFVSIAAVLGTYGVGIVVLLLPGAGLADLAVGCWTALRHGQAPELGEAVGAAGLVVVLLAAARFVHATIRRPRSRRRIHRAHMDYLTSSAQLVPHRHTPCGWTTRNRWPTASPAAPGLIVAATGLNRLPAAQVTAVLSHERAHLRGRHNLLMSMADALARALPFVPPFRHAPAAIGRLVELSADEAAAHACGPPCRTRRPTRPRRPAGTVRGSRHGRRSPCGWNGSPDLDPRGASETNPSHAPPPASRWSPCPDSSGSAPSLCRGTTLPCVTGLRRDRC